MSRRIDVLLISIVALIPGATYAQVAITEIMYDLPNGSDSGREWIEIYNNGTSPVALSGWKIFENGTNHKITAVSGGDALLPGAYAVIADNPTNFKNDWPQFSGQLFDSTFSLSNSGETLVLRNASSTDIDTVTYQSSWGASGDGNSLNRAPSESGSFAARRPSPGAAMSSDAVSPFPAKSTVVSKTKTTSAKNPSPSSPVVDSAPAPDTSDTAASTDTETGNSEVAAVGTVPAGNSKLWWIAAVGLALAAGGSVVAAQRFGKKEWSITEE